jgi:hypothetical protein
MAMHKPLLVHHILNRHELTSQMSNKDVAVCDACQQGKSHQLPLADSVIPMCGAMHKHLSLVTTITSVSLMLIVGLMALHS